MIQRIVTLRSHPDLATAFLENSPEHTSRRLTGIAIEGVEFDASFLPVPVPAADVIAKQELAGPDYLSPQTVYALRATATDGAAIQRLRAHPEVERTFTDPPISQAAYCNDQHVGTTTEVRNCLDLQPLLNDNLEGQNIRVAVVDDGINGDLVTGVQCGWSASDPNYKPGTSTTIHGSKSAFDIRIGAPRAQLLDFVVIRKPPSTFGQFVSDVLGSFGQLSLLLHRHPGPLVVSNGWAVYNLSADRPIGHPENYSANTSHPLYLKTTELIAQGADVCFPSGNCGKDCPDERCKNDRGPGKSIHGASSHPDAITVSAVTLQGERLGYASQGPGLLNHNKPDLCGYSQFWGSGFDDGPDRGTSAASAVVAGVIAALRQHPAIYRLRPSQIKSALQTTASGNGKWDNDYGYGAVHAARALEELLKSP